MKASALYVGAFMIFGERRILGVFIGEKVEISKCLKNGG